MKKIISTAVAGVALLAFPLAAADAKPGKGNGHGPPEHAQAHGFDSGPDTETSEQTREERREAREGRRAARKCKKGRKVGFSVRGTLDGFTAEDVTLAVVRANKHARSFIEGDTHTFALDGARVKFEGVTDADESGGVDFADVAPTDVVKVTGKVVRPKKGCDAGEPAVTIRKVHVERPEADEAEEPEEPEVTEQS